MQICIFFVFLILYGAIKGGFLMYLRGKQIERKNGPLASYRLTTDELCILDKKIHNALHNLDMSQNNKKLLFTHLMSNYNGITTQILLDEIVNLGMEPNEEKLKKSLRIVLELQNIAQGIVFIYYNKNDREEDSLKDTLDKVLSEIITVRTFNENNSDTLISNLNQIKNKILENLSFFEYASKSIPKSYYKNKARYEFMLKYGAVEAAILDIFSLTSIHPNTIHGFMRRFTKIESSELKMSWYKELSKVPSEALKPLTNHPDILLKDSNNYRFIKGYLILYDQWLEGVKNNPDNVEQRLNTASIILRRKSYNADKDKYNEVMAPLIKSLCTEKKPKETIKQFQETDISN